MAQEDILTEILERIKTEDPNLTDEDRARIARVERTFQGRGKQDREEQARREAQFAWERHDAAEKKARDEGREQVLNDIRDNLEQSNFLAEKTAMVMDTARGFGDTLVDMKEFFVGTLLGIMSGINNGIRNQTEMMEQQSVEQELETNKQDEERRGLFSRLFGRKQDAGAEEDQKGGSLFEALGLMAVVKNMLGAVPAVLAGISAVMLGGGVLATFFGLPALLLGMGAIFIMNESKKLFDQGLKTSDVVEKFVMDTLSGIGQLFTDASVFIVSFLKDSDSVFLNVLGGVLQSFLGTVIFVARFIGAQFKVFTELLENLGTALLNLDLDLAIDSILHAFSMGMAHLTSLVNLTFSNMFDAMSFAIKRFFTGVLEGTPLGDLIENSIQKVRDFWSDVASVISLLTFDNLSEFVNSKIAQVTAFITDKVNIVTGFFEDIFNKVVSVFESVTGFFGSIFDSIMSIDVTPIADAVMDSANEVLEFIKESFTQLFSVDFWKGALSKVLKLIPFGETIARSLGITDVPEVNIVPQKFVPESAIEGSVQQTVDSVFGEAFAPGTFEPPKDFGDKTFEVKERTLSNAVQEKKRDRQAAAIISSNPTSVTTVVKQDTHMSTRVSPHPETQTTMGNLGYKYSR